MCGTPGWLRFWLTAVEHSPRACDIPSALPALSLIIDPYYNPMRSMLLPTFHTQGNQGTGKLIKSPEITRLAREITQDVNSRAPYS